MFLKDTFTVYFNKIIPVTINNLLPDTTGWQNLKGVNLKSHASTLDGLLEEIMSPSNDKMNKVSGLTKPFDNDDNRTFNLPLWRLTVLNVGRSYEPQFTGIHEMRGNKNSNFILPRTDRNIFNNKDPRWL